jgi:ribosomal-protein-alanine N-acetyltransferase
MLQQSSIWWQIVSSGQKQVDRLHAERSRPGLPEFVLRRLCASDLPELVRIRSQKRAAEYPFGDPHHGSDAAETAKWISDKSTEDWSGWGIGLAAIVERPSNRFVGYSGLHHIDSLGKLEICYTLAPDYWGRGIASAAVHLLLEYVQMLQICEEIIGLVATDNFRSKKVLFRNGFTRLWSFNEEELEIEYFRRPLKGVPSGGGCVLLRNDLAISLALDETEM